MRVLRAELRQHDDLMSKIAYGVERIELAQAKLETKDQAAEKEALAIGPRQAQAPGLGVFKSAEAEPAMRPVRFDVVRTDGRVALVPSFGPGFGRPTAYELIKNDAGATVEVVPIYQANA